MKQKIPSDPTKTMGLFSVCSAHVAAKYDLPTNVSVLDGMTNGAECTAGFDICSTDLVATGLVTFKIY